MFWIYLFHIFSPCLVVSFDEIVVSISSFKGLDFSFLFSTNHPYSYSIPSLFKLSLVSEMQFLHFSHYAFIFGLISYFLSLLSIFTYISFSSICFNLPRFFIAMALSVVFFSLTKTFLVINIIPLFLLTILVEVYW